MIRWGLVTTAKAPIAHLAAFAAWHLHLGANHLTIYLDDPLDQAHLDHPQITLIRCDAGHWQALGGRPERHQNRQSRNAQHAYRQTRMDWLGHVDVDELLWPDRALTEILAALPPDQILCRAEPFEAMHSLGLPDDIFTATQFRGALKPRFSDLRAPILGRFAAILPEAMLSHSNGKAFFRTGIPRLQPRLHGAFRDGERLPGPPFQPGLGLLHFHAQDRAAWTRALPFRLTRGAYQYHPELQAHLSLANPAQIADFYEETQILTPQKTRMLRGENRLIEARLELRDKTVALFPRCAASLQKGPA